MDTLEIYSSGSSDQEEITNEEQFQTIAKISHLSPSRKRSRPPEYSAWIKSDRPFSMCAWSKDYCSERCSDMQDWISKGSLRLSLRHSSTNTLAQDLRARHEFHNPHESLVVDDPYGTNSRREPFDDEWEFDIIKREQLARMMRTSEPSSAPLAYTEDHVQRAMVREYRGE